MLNHSLTLYSDLFLFYNNKKDINKVLIVKEKVRARTNGFKLDQFRFRKEIR